MQSPTGGMDRWRIGQAYAADGNERARTQALAPAPQFLQALRRPVEIFRARREDRLQRHRVGANVYRALQLLFGFGGDAEAQPGRADRREVCRLQVVLSKMDMRAAQLDGQPPVIVHHQLRAALRAKLFRAQDFRAQSRVIAGALDAKLNQLYAAGEHARDPVRAFENEVERVDRHAFVPAPKVLL